MKGIVSILIFWITVYALSLRLTPADPPGTVAAGSCDRHNGANIIRTKKCIFQDQHSPHRTSNSCRNLLYAQVVEDDFVNTIRFLAQYYHVINQVLLHIITYSSQRKFWAVSSMAWVAINIRDRAGTSIGTTQAVETDDEESCYVECFS